jgi:type VI secretion system protein ImpK
MNTIETGFKSLSDISATLLSTAAELRNAEDPGDADAFRERLEFLFSDFETRAAEVGYGQESVRQAKFAIVALIDGIVLQSHWSIRGEWTGKPLEMQFFNDFNAGQEFFIKLNSLRGSKEKEQLQVLEIYFQCLALGFRGEHADLKGAEQLKLLIESLGRELIESRGYKPSSLSAHWERTELLKDKVRRFPSWVVPVVCACVLLIVYAILHTALGLSVPVG